MNVQVPPSSEPAESGSSTTTRPLAVRKRADVVVVRQSAGGNAIYVLKNPVDLQYYRLLAEEYFIWQQLNGTASLDRLKQAFERRFPPQSVTHAEIQQLVMTLHERNLLHSPVRGQGDQLLKRDGERRRKEWLAKLSNPLALRLRGIDPTRVLDALRPVTWFLFHPLWLFGWGLFALATAILGGLHFEEIQRKLPTLEALLTPSSLFGLAIAMGAVKVVHELGHGLSCKHFGGEVRELGLMFLVLTPCLYCNVSDSWMFSSKWKRAAVGAAGIYFDLMTASAAMWIWWFTVPGALHDAALDVAIVCSVSTLAFNANPLLRFDGYYVVSDLLEIPNLSEKCDLTLKRTAQTVFLGIDNPPDYRLPENRRLFFLSFGIASIAYRWFVTISIMIFFYTFFHKHRVFPVFVVLTTLGFAPRVGRVVSKAYKTLSNPGLLPRMQRPRVVATIVAATLLIVAAFTIPLPNRVIAPAELVPAGERAVYAEVPGTLVEVKAMFGERVDEYSVLARLENLDLRLAETKLRSEYEESAAKLAVLERNQFADRTLALEVALARKAMLAAEELLKERAKDVARLTITAPTTGYVLPPSEMKEEKLEEEALPTWNDSPFAPRNRGCKLEEGTWICSIGDPRRAEAELVIDHRDIEFVAVGQSVKIMFEGLPGEYLRGKVIELAESHLRYSPKRLANNGGGELSSKPDPSGRQRPRQASYYARVELDEFTPDRIRFGVRGRAKISVGTATCVEIADRYLRNFFRFDL